MQNGQELPPDVIPDSIVWLSCRDFDASVSYEWTSFFSTYEPADLYEQLIESMKSENINFTLSGKYCKINFKFKRANKATADSPEAAEQFVEKFKSSVEVLKVPG